MRRQPFFSFFTFKSVFFPSIHADDEDLCSDEIHETGSCPEAKQLARMIVHNFGDYNDYAAKYEQIEFVLRFSVISIFFSGSFSARCWPP